MMRVLCATDLLPKSEQAIDRAGLLAQRQGTNLSLLHVVSPASSQHVFEDSLRIATGRIKSRARRPMWRHGPSPEVIVRAGNPARLILDTLEQQNAGLLVLGPHRKRGMLDALQGTIAEKVLGARKCPVLMVQRDVHAPYEKVLLALDLSSESADAVRVADALLRDTDTRTIVMHAWQPPYKGMLRSVGVGMNEILAYSNDSRREVTAQIRQLLSKEGVESRRYDIAVVDAHAAAAIKQAITVYQPDLLVMGTRGNGPLRRALLGSVANDVLTSAECDVLVVPRGSVHGDERDARNENAKEKTTM
jgi:nucleotide-binding universal stress UspA family protein